MEDEFVDDEDDEFVDELVDGLNSKPNNKPAAKKQKPNPLSRGRASGRANGRGRGGGRGRQSRKQTKADKGVHFQTHYDPLTSILDDSEDEFVDEVESGSLKLDGVQSAETLSFRPAAHGQPSTTESGEEGFLREPIQPSERRFGSMERLKHYVLAAQSQLSAKEDDFVDDEDPPEELLRNATTTAAEAIHEWNQLRLAHETNLVVVRNVLTDELDATHARVSRLLDRLKTPTTKQEHIDQAIVELDQTDRSMQQLCAYETSAMDRLGRIDQPLARAVMISSGRLCI